MSENSAPRSSRFMAVLVAILVAVAAIQGYYLLQMHERLDGNVAYATHEEKVDLNSQPPGKGWNLAPNSGTSNSQGPFAPLSGKPFDPNSWNPFKEIEQMHKQMEGMFDQAFGRFNASPHFNGLLDGFSFNPSSDIEETDNAYIVRLDIPGTDSSKISATIDDRTLTISGAREEEVSEQGPNKQWRSERRLGQFERVLTLPGPAKQEGIKADYKDGVLTITVPKGEDEPQSTPIPIQ